MQSKKEESLKPTRNNINNCTSNGNGSSGVLPNLVDPKNYRLKPNDLFGFFHRDSTVETPQVVNHSDPNFFQKIQLLNQ